MRHCQELVWKAFWSKRLLGLSTMCRRPVRSCALRGIFRLNVCTIRERYPFGSGDSVLLYAPFGLINLWYALGICWHSCSMVVDPV